MSKKRDTEEQAAFVERLQNRYYGDCSGFVRYFFPHLAGNPKSAWQFNEFKKFGALKNINQYAYVGCTGSGKSTLIVLTCIWLCVTRNDPRIVIITSTGKQSETTIFDAIREYIGKSKLKEYFDVGATTVTLKCNGNKIKYFCFGDENDDKGNALRGLHSTDAEKGITAVFLDEANKFGEWVYRKLAGIMADGNCLWVLSSNGGAAEGGFYLRFSNPSYGFQARKITAWDIGMSQERIDAMAANFGGIESEEYLHMICAEFTGGDQSAITLAEMEESKARYSRNVVDYNDREIFMGVDLSGKTSGKSKNCICIRNSTRVLLWQLMDIDPRELKPILEKYIAEYNVKYCFFDMSGVLGTLFKEIAYTNPKIQGFLPQVMCKSNSPFLNRRSEVIFRMIKWIKINGEVPFTDKLYSLFGAVENLIQASHVVFGKVGGQGGKIRHTSKENLEKAGDKVTMDMFDSLSYTFAADYENVANDVFDVHQSAIDKRTQSMAWLQNRNRVKGGDPLKSIKNMRYF